MVLLNCYVVAEYPGEISGQDPNALCCDALPVKEII
jgi:hypothetical protein